MSRVVAIVDDYADIGRRLMELEYPLLAVPPGLENFDLRPGAMNRVYPGLQLERIIFPVFRPDYRDALDAFDLARSDASPPPLSKMDIVKEALKRVGEPQRRIDFCGQCRSRHTADVECLW